MTGWPKGEVCDFATESAILSLEIDFERKGYAIYLVELFSCYCL